VRLFVAINPTAEVQAAVHEATAPLRDAVPEIRWIKAERIHLTVRFLGEQSESLLPSLTEALADAAAKSSAMTLTFAGAGAFPGFKRARVVWLGVDYEPRLELLYHDVETACMSLGFEVEGRVFRPHLTLGRVPQRLADDRARDLARAARGIRLRIAARVESVDLMRSGSPYTVVSRAPLRTV
jgi:2'-5' RNA ligase